jgi:hypothetical protein
VRVPGHRQQQIEYAYLVVAGEIEPCRKWTQLLSHYGRVRSLWSLPPMLWPSR